MDKNENHQIDLRPEEKETTNNNQTESTNPPLIDYIEKPKNKNNMILVGIIGIFGFLILGIAGYYIYNYFNPGKKATFKNINISNEPAKIDIIEEPKDERPNANVSNFLPGYLTSESGDSEGILVSPSEISAYNKNKQNKPAEATTFKPAEKTTTTPAEPVDGIIAGWKPNDYRPGDIKGSTYTVIKGDTLWEISEGRYEQGIKWRKIQSANNVGYLKNGNPLIVVGQNLSLPE